ncbi:MAG TPA: DUF4142 domain-containing protein, partial [Gemmatimonadaceae bacterium]|nr:DUF4142 domain-containing protein [Gemmatimonadaceae bacterium]
MHIRSLLVLPLALALGACSLFGRGGAAESAAPAGAAGSGLTDANIAAIVVAANNADILYADMALAKSQDADVRSFATMVKSDHESVNRSATELVTRLKVTPVDNQVSFD